MTHTINLCDYFSVTDFNSIVSYLYTSQLYSHWSLLAFSPGLFFQLQMYVLNVPTCSACTQHISTLLCVYIPEERWPGCRPAEGERSSPSLLKQCPGWSPVMGCPWTLGCFLSSAASVHALSPLYWGLCWTVNAWLVVSYLTRRYGQKVLHHISDHDVSIQRRTTSSVGLGLACLAVLTGCFVSLQMK